MIVGLVFCLVFIAVFLKSLKENDLWRYRILTLFFLTFLFCGYFWVYHVGQWSQYHQYLALTPKSAEEKMFKYDLIKRHLKKLQRTEPSEDHLKHLYEVCVQTNDYGCTKSSALDLMEQGIVPNDVGLQLVKAEYHLHQEKMSKGLVLALNVCENTADATSCNGYHARALFNSGYYKAASKIWAALLKNKGLSDSKKRLYQNAINQCQQKLNQLGGKTS